MEKRKIAIACQGGGSQTAFTAGALSVILERIVHSNMQIVSFSGTSGGAICAALAWFSHMKRLRGDTTPLSRRLFDFWRDNSTQYLHEDLLNLTLVGSLRFIEAGFLPMWASSPSDPYVKTIWPLITSVLPHQTFYNLKQLIETHLDFGQIASWQQDEGPALIVGATEVLTGEFKKFSSRKGEITADALMASAAVPTLFPAVQIGKDAYWDGLFSDNPPTDELLDEEMVGFENLPDELWVIQINPQTCASVPVSTTDIADRRNEMIGNESLYQGLEKIELINKLLAKGALTPEFQAKYRPVRLQFIAMSPSLQAKLDYPTKLDRSRILIDQMMRDGQAQARKLLTEIGSQG